MKLLKNVSWKAWITIAVFLAAYLLLGIVKHNHFLSGYDLAVSDQVMWKYAYFHNPLTTIHTYPFTYMMADHVEFIYIFLAPLFWIWNDARMLISAQAIFFSLSAIPVYLLARKKGLNELFSIILIVLYLSFFGVQNALWNDVHSNVFGAGFIAWMIYFLENKTFFGTFLFLFLAITSKEDMAFLTLAIGITWFTVGVYGQKGQKKFHLTNVFQENFNALAIIGVSLIYLFIVFGIYFPYFTVDGYRFSYHEPLMKSLNLVHFADTPMKREIIVYSLGWFGFLPLLVPIYLIPWFADLFHFFVIGHLVESAQEIFLHYRVSLTPLLIWPTIITLSKWKRLQNPAVAVYLILCAFLLQYSLHLPLSYLTKSWYWHTGPEVTTINKTLQYLPSNASVVSQINIAPHIGHRDNIFTLWPTTLTYKNLSDSPCGKYICRWFHWVGSPKYMIVDTSPDFDIRHFLQNRPDFLEALSTFEKLGKIKVFHRQGTTTLYKVLQNP